MTATIAATPTQAAIRARPIYTGWRLLAAGGLAGALTNTILHPLDTVKTVRQADPKNYSGVTNTIVSIVRKRGPFALYSGIAPALVGSAFSSALYFGFYEFVKKTLTDHFPALFQRSETRIPLTALSAACGNVASSILFVPKEVVKQRMQSGVASGNFIAAASGVIKTAGLPGLYRGYKATLLRNVPSTMIRFALYEEFKLIIKRVTGCEETDQLTNREFIIAGALAGVLSSVCTTPMDVLKTRFATGKIAAGTSIVAALKNIVRTDGFRGLFVGVRPRIVWSALFTSIGFSSYEMCKKLLMNRELFPSRMEMRKRRVFPKNGVVRRNGFRIDGNRRVLLVSEVRSRRRYGV